MAKLSKTPINKARKELLSYALKRRDVIKVAGDAQHHAKRAIFALHRDNEKEAEQKLKESLKGLKSLEKKYAKSPKLLQEGSYKAGLEEYVEAELFYQFVTAGKIGDIKDIGVSSEIFIAGLCDVPGELQRYAIKAATNHDLAIVKQCSEMAQQIIGELIEFNLTSYLRNKFDQAKNAARRLEQVVYETSIRQ